MTFEFFLYFGFLNLFFLILEKREQIKKKTKLVEIKAIEIFKYRKNNDKHCDRTRLYKQIVDKVLLII